MNATDSAPMPRGQVPPQGVVRLLKDHITARLVAQLDSKSRVFSTMEAVTQGIKRLVDQMNSDDFRPNVILYWQDLERTYRGSVTVATALASEMNVPTKLIETREDGGMRELLDDFSWMAGLSRVLVVDDACYSGRTLLAIASECSDAEPMAVVRCAALATLDPTRVPHLYFAHQHQTEDLLFPWGWSRSIENFYDIYRFFGILDRRAVSEETESWGSLARITEDFFGGVELLELSPAVIFHYAPERIQDMFLYVVHGQVQITIGPKTGLFEQRQHLFIPREVEYSLYSDDGATVLQLAARSR